MNYVIIYDYKTNSGWVRRRYETSKKSFYNMILNYIQSSTEICKLVEATEGKE